MKPSLPFLLLCLALSTNSLMADNKKPKPKQEAKDLFAKSTTDADPIAKIQDACTAAQLEPKEKKYTEACTQAKANLVKTDAANLQTAIDALHANEPDKAEAAARQVTSVNDKLYAQAHEVMAQVANVRRYNQAQAAWYRGDLEGVKANAQAITDPNLQESLKTILSNLELYNTDIKEGQKLETEHPSEALKQYEAAHVINSKVPDNLESKIAELKARISRLNNPVVSTQTPAPPPPPPPSTPPANLLVSAKAAEEAGHWQEALVDYQAILTKQPNNKVAKDGVARAQSQIEAADLTSLKKAIRDFYDFKLDDARTELNTYLSAAPQGLSPGAAYFYLGATLLEQSLLSTPQGKWQGPPPEVRTAFQQARKASYTPVRKYVPQALITVWDATSQ